MVDCLVFIFAAATYYLDEFSCGSEKFQDGALTANNPAVVALQEACLLWPNTPIDVSACRARASNHQRNYYVVPCLAGIPSTLFYENVQSFGKETPGLSLSLFNRYS